MIILKRKVKDGFIFLNEDRTFKSKVYQTREKRDIECEKYMSKQQIILDEYKERRKKELQLING